MQTDPVDELIEFAHAATYSNITPSVIEHQKRRIADNVACIVAGARAEGTAQLFDVLNNAHSGGSCLVIGRTDRLAPREAAMLNSLAGRALDFCDVIAPGYHPSSTDVPTVLAMAESCGSSGREAIEAMAVAQDVVCRIGAATVPAGQTFSGFDGNVLAPLGAALIAGRLLKLSAVQLREAIGLAANASAGSFQAVQDKVLAARFSQAYATRSGIEAALLAGRGVTGIRRLLGGDLSFSQLFAGRAIDKRALRQGLGEVWYGPDRTCFKLYPSCGVTLALTDAVLRLVKERQVDPNGIRRMRVRASRTMMMLCGQNFAPGDVPEVSAMFSIQYVLASALLRGRSTLAEFTRSAVLDETARELASRVEVEMDESFERHDECLIEIQQGASTLTVHAVHGLGWPENPPSQEDFRDKLAQCFSFAGAPSPDVTSRHLIEVVSTLEQASSLDVLLAAL